MAKDVYDIGEIPPVGEVPRRMHAQLVRPDRYGEPEDAIRDEVIDVPEIGPDDALVLVMAAGVNFNNVWAARGVPVDVTKTRPDGVSLPTSTSSVRMLPGSFSPSAIG
jgi:crotonyl-CoA carboxylase/reductase